VACVKGHIIKIKSENIIITNNCDITLKMSNFNAKSVNDEKMRTFFYITLPMRGLVLKKTTSTLVTALKISGKSRH